MTRKNHVIGKENEKAFETLLRTIYGKRVAINKLADTAAAQGKVFIPPQPSDYIVTANDMTFYAEVKHSENRTSFPFSDVRKAQIGYGRIIRHAGGHYLFFLFSAHNQKWYIVPYDVMDFPNRNSVRWDELKDYEIVS